MVARRIFRCSALPFAMVVLGSLIAPIPGRSILWTVALAADRAPAQWELGDKAQTRLSEIFGLARPDKVRESGVSAMFPPRALGGGAGEIAPWVYTEFGLDPPMLIDAPRIERGPAVAATPDSFLVVWTEGGWIADIGGTRISPSGQVLEPHGFAIGHGFNVRAAAAGRNYLVVWQADLKGQDSSYGLVARRVSHDGVALDPPAIVVTPGPVESGYAVASNGHGFLVVWEAYGG